MKIDGKHYLTIWHNENEDNVCIIDQTKLPFEFIIKKIKYLSGWLCSNKRYACERCSTNWSDCSL
jgi:hypothetical protein